MRAALGEAAWRVGRSAWPGIVVDERTFASYAEALAPAASESEIVHAEDLYLAFGALQGDAAALRELDRICTPIVDAIVRRMKVPDPGEAHQLVRERLLLGRDGGPGKLAEYTGRGRLKNWLRILSVRVLLNRIAVRERELPFEQETLARLLGASLDLEIAYMKDLYKEAFHAAFDDALRELGSRERLFLRLSFLEGLTIDDLSRLYGIHRATAARQIVRAERALYDGVRRSLKARLGVDDAEFDSILRLVKSQLSITFERYLNEA
jgi:RNA polymerase sigma-70 factor (ECF subfamily)